AAPTHLRALLLHQGPRRAWPWRQRPGPQRLPANHRAASWPHPCRKPRGQGFQVYRQAAAAHCGNRVILLRTALLARIPKRIRATSTQLAYNTWVEYPNRWFHACWEVPHVLLAECLSLGRSGPILRGFLADAGLQEQTHQGQFRQDRKGNESPG